jgi:hypothetical protein
MIGTLLATVLVTTPVLGDTIVRLGIVERDLTGDNVPEILSLTGRGQTIDSLEVTFTITSSGRAVFETKWSETRAVGFDAGRRVLSAAEHRRRLRELGREFFADEKFMSPAEFLTMLRGSAPRHIDLIPDVIARDLDPRNRSRAQQIWDEMKAAGITLFEFSVGGDAVTTIGWSGTDERFYHLWSCC